MLRNNFWFQLALFLALLSMGIYYILKGVRKKHWLSLIAGVFALTLAWTKATLMLNRLDLNPILKNVLDISELIVPLAGLCFIILYSKNFKN